MANKKQAKTEIDVKKMNIVKPAEPKETPTLRQRAFVKDPNAVPMNEAESDEYYKEYRKRKPIAVTGTRN